MLIKSKKCFHLWKKHVSIEAFLALKWSKPIRLFFAESSCNTAVKRGFHHLALPWCLCCAFLILYLKFVLYRLEAAVSLLAEIPWNYLDSILFPSTVLEVGCTELYCEFIMLSIFFLLNFLIFFPIRRSYWEYFPSLHGRSGANVCFVT